MLLTTELVVTRTVYFLSIASKQTNTHTHTHTHTHVHITNASFLAELREFIDLKALH